MTLNTKTGTGTPGLERSRYRADNYRKRLKRYLSRPPAKGSVYPWLCGYHTRHYIIIIVTVHKHGYSCSCCSLRGDLCLFISLRYQFHALISTNLLELRYHRPEDRSNLFSTIVEFTHQVISFININSEHQLIICPSITYAINANILMLRSCK